MPAQIDTSPARRIVRSSPLIDHIRENCCYHPYCNFQTDSVPNPVKRSTLSEANEAGVHSLQANINNEICSVNFSYRCDQRCLSSLGTARFSRVEMAEAEAYCAHQATGARKAEGSENDLMFHVYWDPRGGKAVNNHIRLSLYSILATQRNANAPTYDDAPSAKRSAKRDESASNLDTLTGSERINHSHALPAGKAIVRLWIPKGASQGGFLQDKVLARELARGRLVIAPLDLAAEIERAKLQVQCQWLSVQSMKQRVLDWVFWNVNVVGLTDLLRYLLTFNYGGVYLDADVMLLRDLTPLLNNEFAYQWSFLCEYNSAITYIRKGSQIARMFLEASEFEYRLLHPFRLREMCDADAFCRENYLVYPPAFFDPLWVVHDYLHALALDEKDMGKPTTTAEQQFAFVFFFQPRTKVTYHLGESMRHSYAYHWHNEWKTEFSEESFAMYYMKLFENVLLADIRS